MIKLIFFLCVLHQNRAFTFFSFSNNSQFPSRKHYNFHFFNDKIHMQSQEIISSLQFFSSPQFSWVYTCLKIELKLFMENIVTSTARVCYTLSFLWRVENSDWVNTVGWVAILVVWHGTKIVPSLAYTTTVHIESIPKYQHNQNSFDLSGLIQFSSLIIYFFFTGSYTQATSVCFYFSRLPCSFQL